MKTLWEKEENAVYQLKFFPILFTQKFFFLFTERQNFRLVESRAFADDEISTTQNLKFVLGRVENFVGKGENADYQHFLLFPQCFQKPSIPGLLKPKIVLKKVNSLPHNRNF